MRRSGAGLDFPLTSPSLYGGCRLDDTPAQPKGVTLRGRSVSSRFEISASGRDRQGAVVAVLARRAVSWLALFGALAAIAVGIGATAPASAQKSILGFEEPGPDTPLNLNADQMTYSRDGRTAIATGNVEIQYGQYTVFADTVSYNRDNGNLTAAGHVRLVEPGGNVIEAEHIVLSKTFRDGFVRQLTLLMTNYARLHARSAERRDGNITIFRDATYFVCKACLTDASKSPIWQIRAKKVVRNKAERMMYYEDAFLDFFDVPIIYIPRFSTPDPTVRRKTGFLVPSFSASDEFGVGVEVPYYLNLAPSYDLTLSPLITSEQGPVFKGEWRQRFSSRQYKIKPTGVYQLDKKASPGDTRARGSVETAGDFNLSDDWRFGWDATIASDDTYLRRYKINNDTDLISQVYLTGLSGRNYFDMRSYYFRALLQGEDNDRTPYVLPSIDHSYIFDQPVLGGELGINSSFLNLQRDSGTDSTRVISEVTWKRRMVGGMGQVITPFASVRGDVFMVDNVVDPTVPGGVRSRQTIGRVLPTAGLDIRLPMVRQTAHGQHIFEPVAQVIARTNETNIRAIANEDSQSFEFDDVNLFSIDKFTGDDRWEGGVRANLGFNYTVNFNSGAATRFAFGQSYQIAGRNSFTAGTGLNGDYSDFVGSAYFLLNEYFTGSFRFRLDRDSLNIRRNEIAARTHFGRITSILSFVDIDRNPAFGLSGNETEILNNTSIQVDERWRLFGGIRYDIKRDHLTSDLIGIGYEDEALGFQLQYSESFTRDRDIDPERSVMARIVLKTIGSSGVSAGIK